MALATQLRHLSINLRSTPVRERRFKRANIFSNLPQTYQTSKFSLFALAFIIVFYPDNVRAIDQCSIEIALPNHVQAGIIHLI
jgi:hypothetical protein